MARRQASKSPATERQTLSSVVSTSHLRQLYRRPFRIDKGRRRRGIAGDIREKVFAGMDIVKQGEIEDSYSSFFAEGDCQPRAIPQCTPPCLQRLFRLLQYCANTNSELFGYNGAGKTFLSELLSLLPLGGVTGYCKVSTTTNPKYDWCGVVPSQGEPNVCGVADVILETMEGLPLVVGEIKSGSSREGAYQLLAAAYFLQQRKGQRVLGKYPSVVKA